ncbi:MFS general substrate transporter [Hesseltinella vesiculosa]|uniref:MFS general substrate transporter n=1 Tax=Hesseltinella vesiculosa TaxID=101127 RepID=A0A1X2G569_9FUNG|nr:MFS general substrate transporter [Hesseltinella vesiculosa]
MFKSLTAEILVDQNGKATNFPLLSFRSPNMRAFHMSWLSFMIAFFSWFAVPPLATAISSDLKISASDMYDSNVSAVAVTIVARIVVGPLCEHWGPRRVMVALLVCGSIPAAMVGLVENGAGLIAIRCIIGILGATFVPCQFWATQMFSPARVGTANALVGGWGNMGAGLSYLVLMGIFQGLQRVVSTGIAWRLTFLFPTLACLIVAFMDFFLAVDSPNGDWLAVRRVERDTSVHGDASIQSSGDEEKVQVTKIETYDTNIDRRTVFVLPKDQAHEVGSLQDVRKDETFTQTLASYGRTLMRPTVLILCCQYACSFGIELSIDNIIGSVFLNTYKLEASTAAYIGSIFGLLNICSRFTGGLLSDTLAKKLQLRGRILAQLILMSLEGAFLIGFSFILDENLLYRAIIMMVCFSFFVQAVCGSTYGIVPFVDPANTGKVMGLVGSFGNVGGLVFGLLFKSFGIQYHMSFLILGICTLTSGILGCALLRVQGRMLWN